MSGHSKWATTKHKKAANDAKRAKLWAKLIRNIEVATRTGGADVDGNPTLYDAVYKARKNSVPNDNIDRAFMRGAGLSGDTVEYTSILYEGYGPNGVAMLIECLTDNKNRAAAEVRLAVTRNGGTMADPGSVAYNFARKGVISITKTDDVTEDAILEAVLDAGAEPRLQQVIALRRGHRVLSRGVPEVLQANAAMQAHPVVQRHIGDIREAAFDRDASWAAEGELYVFDLKGSKGAGRLEAEFITVDADSERIGDGELVMADGKRYPLDPK